MNKMKWRVTFSSVFSSERFDRTQENISSYILFSVRQQRYLKDSYIISFSFQWHLQKSQLELPRSKNTGRLRQESTENRRNVEAVFPPENVWIFPMISDRFLPESTGN